MRREGRLGLYLRFVGRKVSSDALVGSGMDALMDAIVSASTIVAAVIHLSSGVGTEAWLAAAIALLICSTGVKLLFSTVSKLLGERIDPQIISQVEDAASEIEGVKLASGITLQDFGPERLHGTLCLAWLT